MTQITKGGCQCGAVQFELTGPLDDVVACHCEQCRRTSGHFYAATRLPKSGFRLTRDAGLTWFRASDTARRGFCGGCGASLFWERGGSDMISVAAGCLDSPTGLRIKAHIFTADKGDYYVIDDGVAQYDQAD